jgi:hypothetical protein
MWAVQTPDSAELTVTAALDGDRMRVTVVGDVDLSTVDILRNQLDTVVGQPRPDTVVDLGGVSFLTRQDYPRSSARATAP